MCTTQDISDKFTGVIEFKVHRDLFNTLEWMNKNKLTFNLRKKIYSYR